MMVLASTSGDVLNYALAVFFVAGGLGLAYMLVRLGGTFCGFPRSSAEPSVICCP